MNGYAFVAFLYGATLCAVCWIALIAVRHSEEMERIRHDSRRGLADAKPMRQPAGTLDHRAEGHQ